MITGLNGNQFIPLSQEQDQKVGFVSTADEVCIGEFTFWKMASKVSPVIPNHWLC